VSREVVFEPAARMHSAFREIYDFPPDGYTFTRSRGAWDRGMDRVIKSDFLVFTLHRRLLERVLPLSLLKARLEGWTKPPITAGLTFAINHVVFRPEPWVVLAERVPLLAGFGVGHLPRYRRIIERRLASPWCRAILTWSQGEVQSFHHNLDPAASAGKLHVLPLAVRPKQFQKTYNDTRVRMLFVGTADAPGAFDLKGGKEVLEAFRRLALRYPHAELVVRSDVPADLARRYAGVSNLRIIDRVIPWDALEREYVAADIFLMPAYGTPWRAILEAMSYELPVVTTDMDANAEIVQDGVTGFVVPLARHMPFYDERYMPLAFTRRRAEREQAMRTLNEEVVQHLVAKLAILIHDTALRRRMGRTARHDVEAGRFSIGHRNTMLKRVFDEAVGSGPRHGT
jgi:glycosyltransferase involved in cell wall biosynthesis